MTKQKQLYCAPCTEVLVVQTEEGILSVSGTGNPNSWSNGNTNWFNDED